MRTNLVAGSLHAGPCRGVVLSRLAGIDFNLDRERDRRIWIRPQIAGISHPPRLNTNPCSSHSLRMEALRRYLAPGCFHSPRRHRNHFFSARVHGRDILESGHIRSQAMESVDDPFSRAISYVLVRETIIRDASELIIAHHDKLEAMHPNARMSS